MTNPTIELTFLKNDITAGHSLSQTISNSYIVAHSAFKNEQLFSALKASSDTVAVTLARLCPSIADIIRTEGDVKAVLKDGTTVLFTGYLSTNHNWTVDKNGKKQFNITIEDVGTRLLPKEFISSGKHLFNGTFMNAVTAICQAAGISIATDVITIPGTVTKVVNAGQTCREILQQICYEKNCVYYFGSDGKLRLFSYNITSLASAVAVGDSDLYEINSTGVQLQKSIRRYHSVRVAYTTLSNASDYLIYRNKTGGDDTHFCNFVLHPGEYFDGAEIYTAQEWQAQTLDSFREPTLIEACNAESESSIVGSNEIISCADLVETIVYTGTITHTVESVGGNVFTILIHNTGNTDAVITQQDIKASIVYVKSNGVVRTSPVGQIASGDALLEEEVEFIHSKESAQAHANLVAQYNQNCNGVYTFYSDKDIECGKIVHLQDTIYSGLDVYVLIMSRAFEIDEGKIQYKAVGISPFSLTDDVYHGTETPGQQSIPVPPASPITVVEYAYGDADGPYESVLGYTDDEDYVFLGYLENEDTVMLGSVGEWGKEALTPRYAGEYVWQRIGSYLPPQAEEEIDNWVISRLGAYDKALELFVESDVAYRDLRTPSQVNMLRVVVATTGFTSRYSVNFYENATDGSLYGHYDRETGYLTIPYDVNSTIKQIIGVVTLTDTDGTVYTSSKSIKIVDRTTLGAVFGEVTTVPTGTTYTEGSETKNYLKNDSKIYIQDSFSLTDDTYFVENEEYYKKVGNNYVLATDVEAGQPITANTYYIKTVIKTIYVFNGTSWDILTANFDGFEQISLDNIPYVFADPRVNIADANGLTWIKNLVAQSISSIYYFVGKGGAIYSGSYKRDGSNPTNGNGIYISSDGYVEVNGIDVKGNSYIHGDSLVGGTLINTYEYDVNNVHKEQPIFKTNKSQSGSVTLNAQNKADTLAFLYSELPSAIKNYYASRITKNALLSVNNAYFCGQSVTHICYGQPTLPQQLDKTVSNTGSSSTYNSLHFVVPAGTPSIVYSYDLRATRSVNDSLFNSGTIYGKIELVVIRNGQTITTWLNKKEGVILASYNTEYATSTYQLQGDDDVTVRFYGCRIDGKDKYVSQKSAYCDHFSPQSQIGDANELNLFRSGTYLGTPTSIVAGMSGYCTNLTTGFVNMHPTTGWTGTTPMTLNSSNWGLSAVNKFYKLQWNGLAPTRATAVSTFTSASYIEYNGTRYTSTQIISITATSTSIQFIVLANQGSTQQVVTFLTNSYANTGTFKVVTESPSALLGAYSLNLLPITDYDSQAITDPSQAGNVGTSTAPWTIGFATQGWQQGSARKLKEDIEKYQGNATELLENTEICQFYYKGTTGEQRYLNIGFIADDTDALLSSPKHNVQVTGSCVGLLIKAVQELNDRIKQLEEANNVSR